MSRKNNKKSRKKHTTRPTKSKLREREMTEMPSPSDYKYTILETESSEDESSEQERRLKVYIYESELAKIKNWVLLHSNIETGGDLFGLWIDAHTAVVQFALGPGRKCNRYETAFFQDLDYLGEAGGYLTEKHGLCNLGQWHSHHQLSLNKPSSGDENTVWGHMPNLGLMRYIVCIANITKRSGHYHAGVNCFLFELNDREEKLPVLKGTFEKLNQDSPVNEDSKVAQVIAQGAESLVESVCHSDSDDSSESYWFRCKCKARNFWYGFRKCMSSTAGKWLTFLGLVAVSLIVFGTVFLIKNYDNIKI